MRLFGNYHSNTLWFILLCTFFIVIIFFNSYYHFSETFTKENMKLEAYVITLRHEARLKNIEEQQKKLPLPIQLVDGVKGDKLNLDELVSKNILNPNASFLQLPIHKRVVGCYLSHVSVYEKIKTSSTGNYSIIFEDDFTIHCEDLISEIQKIISTLNEKNIQFDIIYLGNSSNNKGANIQDNIHHFDKNCEVNGTHGYIINNKSIDKIIEYTKIINDPIDTTFQFLGRDDKLNLIVIDPVLVQQIDGMYSIINDLSVETMIQYPKSLPITT